MSWNCTGRSQGPLLVVASLTVAEIMVFTFPFNGINMQDIAFVGHSAGSLHRYWYPHFVIFCGCLNYLNKQLFFPCQWSLLSTSRWEMYASYGHFNWLSLKPINQVVRGRDKVEQVQSVFLYKMCWHQYT